MRLLGRAAAALAALMLPLAVAAAGLAGCMNLDDRDPVPVEALAVLADGGYRLNGVGMDEHEVRLQLKRIAERYHDSELNQARVVVRMTVDSQVDYDAVRTLEDYLVSLGITRIEHDH
jgi:hypothetical protein